MRESLRPEHLRGGLQGDRSHPGRDERGATLIISMAILALLTLFALTFVKLVNFERRATVNYTDSVRAKLLAKAGIKRAIAELQRIATQHHYSNPSDDTWGYALNAPLPAAQMELMDLDLNLLSTTTPSFRNNPGNPLTPNPTVPASLGVYRMWGKHLAVSGTMGQTYEGGLDAYKLKVVDTASQLNLNHPDGISAARMLKNLLLYCDERDGDWSLPASGAGSAAEIADEVVAARPTDGFHTKTELERLLIPFVGEERWFETSDDAARPPLRDLITVHSWMDEKVIRPWALNTSDTIPAGDREETRQGLDLVEPGRAPINLNTAAVPVLVALLADLEARNELGTFRLGYPAARQLALRIEERRRSVAPFRSWPEFERWIDGLDTGGATPQSNTFSPGTLENRQTLTPANLPDAGQFQGRDLSPLWMALEDRPNNSGSQALRDLVKAALNPNTMLTKFGAPVNHGGTLLNGMPFARLVDKADLIAHTTEGCFDAMGVYEITSLGMILKRDPLRGATLTDMGIPSDENEVGVVAAQTQRVIVRIYDVFRLTTQDDFENNRALFADGDFIQDYKHWFTGLGYNRANEQMADFDGWPSLVSNPVYSLARDNTTIHLPADGYAPANYDGSLILSNLQGKRVFWMDFVAGFARGSTDAFKVRAWWDPKDQEPYNDADRGRVGGEPIHPSLPSHPRRAYPPLDLTGMTPEEWKDQDPFDPAQDVSGSNPGWPSQPDYSGYLELNDLAQSKRFANNHRVAHFDPAQPGVDPDPLPRDDRANPSSCTFFREGSSLWNGGVAIGPDRNLDDDGNPAVLAFSGDNLELTKGCSIRFWVMPTVDPYLREEEVLFSFIGSRDGVAREVGFRVIKRSSVAGVSIVLQAAPSDEVPTGGPYRWHTTDGAQGVWTDEVSIDVTPRTTQGASRDAVDPFNPEWIPGTWHWVVINYGWTGRTKDTSLEDSDPDDFSEVVLPMYDISLQVDLSPTQPPLGVDVGDEDPGRIAFLGEIFLSPGYGEVHGYDRTNTGHSMPMARAPLGYWTAEPPLGGGPISNWNAANSHGGSPPITPPVGENALLTMVRRTDYYAEFFIYPRPLGDFYNCNLSASYSRQQHEIVLPNAIHYNSGTNEFETSLTEGLRFPPNSFEHTVWARFRSGPNQTAGPIWSDGSTGNDPPTDDGGEPTATLVLPANGELALTYDNGTWTLPLPPEGHTHLFGADENPGSGDDYVVDILLKYTMLEKDDNNPYNYAKEVDGEWDGAAMRRFVQENPPPPDDTSWPPPMTTELPDEVDRTFRNGTFHDSSMTFVNGIPFASAAADADGLPVVDQRSRVTFASRLTGHLARAADPPLPGAPDTLPADYIADDCHGCENCDVDGPIWVGGEPAGNANEVAGALAPVDPDTIAHAVFDNLMILNSTNRRTDYIASGGQIVDWYEDRFFEDSAVSGYFEQSLEDPVTGEEIDLPNAGNNFGAVYRRGLLELLTARRRLASMTWTSYSSSDGRLTYDVSLSLLRGEGPGQDSHWRAENTTIATLPVELPTGFRRWDHDPTNDGNFDDGFEQDEASRPIGLVFGPDVVYDGVGSNTEDGNKLRGPDILLLGVQLRGLVTPYLAGVDADGIAELENAAGTAITGSVDRNPAVDGSGNPVPYTGGLPTPILETPVFEDVTLNLLRDTAQILDAEEGAAE